MQNLLPSSLSGLKMFVVKVLGENSKEGIEVKDHKRVGNCVSDTSPLVKQRSISLGNNLNHIEAQGMTITPSLMTAYQV